jgi:hypothetical protein
MDWFSTNSNTLLQSDKKPKMKYTSFLLLIFVAFSCGTWRKVNLDEFIERSNCYQQEIYAYSSEDLPVPLYMLSLDTLLTNNFSFNSLNIAHAFGFLEDIAKFTELVEQTAPSEEQNLAKKIEILQLRQRINNAIHMASIEVSAVASEMDCEEERADQIASYLYRKEGKSEKRLTVSAIVSGAFGTILSAFIVLNDPDDNNVEYVGVLTGLTEVIFGSLLLTNERKVQFNHERNALRDLWEGRTISSIFPPPIWYYLNYYDPNLPEEDSKRNLILEKWMKFGQISASRDKKKNKLIELYFMDGGYYTAQQLENRANMHDQVESQINLIKQNLKTLASELDSFVNNKI